MDTRGYRLQGGRDGAGGGYSLFSWLAVLGVVIGSIALGFGVSAWVNAGDIRITVDGAGAEIVKHGEFHWVVRPLLQSLTPDLVIAADNQTATFNLSLPNVNVQVTQPLEGRGVVSDPIRLITPAIDNQIIRFVNGSWQIDPLANILGAMTTPPLEGSGIVGDPIRLITPATNNQIIRFVNGSWQFDPLASILGTTTARTAGRGTFDPTTPHCLQVQGGVAGNSTGDSMDITFAFTPTAVAGFVSIYWNQPPVVGSPTSFMRCNYAVANVDIIGTIVIQSDNTTSTFESEAQCMYEGATSQQVAFDTFGFGFNSLNDWEICLVTSAGAATSSLIRYISYKAQ